MQVQTTTGTFPVAFSTRYDSLSGMEFLQSDTLRVGSNTTGLSMQYRVWLQGWQPSQRLPHVPLFRLRLLDANTHQPLLVMRESLLDTLRAGDYQVVDSLTVDLSPYIGRQLFVQMQSAANFLNGETQTMRIKVQEFSTPSGNRGLTAKVSEQPAALPTKFALLPNYPNPFNPETTISYQLPPTGQAANSQVNLTVYNLNGQIVRRLVKGNQPAGTYSVKWDGTDDRGVPVASGVYFYRLTTGSGFVATRKMILLR